jgi:phosphomethylpyrimidine synthase
MSEFATAFPNSQKVFVDGPQGVRVPMREVALSKGEPSIRLYDTSGPQDHDVKNGLPKLREPWVKARLGSAKALAATRSRAAAPSSRRTSTISSSSR